MCRKPITASPVSYTHLDVYKRQVTTRGGRYVQGGGCTTVGVAGLVLSGGFGNFSKNYGTAAAGLLEAEIVTADGQTRIANACTNADLFWALKGGGGGSLGVVTRPVSYTHLDVYKRQLLLLSSGSPDEQHGGFDTLFFSCHQLQVLHNMVFQHMSILHF